MGPLLDALRELGGSGRPAEVRDQIADRLGITDAQREEMLPSGATRVYDNRVHWARFYLAKLGMIESSSHGVWRITDKGRAQGTLKLHSDAVAAHGSHRSALADARSDWVRIERVEFT